MAAWLVDRLVREVPDDLERVLEVAAELRAAQEEGDRNRLRVLMRERRSLLAEVAAAAADRARAEGQRIGDTALEEFQQTLQAAMASPAAAAAIRSGRLVRALDADGLDPVDLDGAVAGGAAPLPGTSAGSRPPRRPRSDDTSRKAAAEAKAAQEAEAQVEAEAERRRRIEEAERRSADAAAAARAAQAVAEERDRDLADLRKRLDELQARVGVAASAADEARARAERARQEADEAAAAVAASRSGS